MNAGTIDIAIPAHWLSKMWHSKNLGWVIIDEEHRFRRAAKEALKALAAKVDVLTLNPIPRTLAIDQICLAFR